MSDFKEITDCPITITLAFIGGRWKTVILYILADKTLRFGEIAARIPAVSRKVLTEQLKELERDDLISRHKYNEIPPRVEYTVTSLGKSLNQVLRQMEQWGNEKGKPLLEQKSVQD